MLFRIVVLTGAVVLHGCKAPPTQVDTPADGAIPPATMAPFSERAAELGLAFVHFNGMAGEHYLAEPLGAGAALFDYDNDGDLDVYLVQGNMLGPHRPEEALIPPPEQPPLTDRLFRNELAETGRLHFVDVTSAAGIRVEGYGMGVAAGDFDGDGWVDLYVTNFGPNVFLRNHGDGTFRDITRQTGTPVNLWSASAAFVDYDRDDRLDLFVTNYVDFTFATHKECYLATSARDYCGPNSFNPYPDRLFHNEGDGTFADVTASSRVALQYGAGLGVVCGDFNADGWVDIYVANDGTPSQLWINQHDGTFRDDAMLSGCALSADGKAEAGMGVDAGDYDGDGDEDLFITHLTSESSVLYRNDGRGMFDDFRAQSGLGPPSSPYTGFGTSWFDYDNDGWLDLLVANGAIRKIPALLQAGDRYPLHQRKQLFHNRGDGRFDEVSESAGAPFELSEVGRGAAFGDLDNDGDTDVVITNNSGPARVLINELGTRNHWLGLRMLGADRKVDQLGTNVELIRGDGTRLWRRVHSAASYLCANDARVLFGLGAQRAVRTVRAHWPDGTIEEWSALPVDRYHVLARGTGTPAGR